MIALAENVTPPAETTLAVGIGQCIVTRDPAATLTAFGLGSCVGVAAWDPFARVAGLIHILLPQPPATNPATNPARFASTGIPYFLEQIEAAGGIRSRLRLTAAGGAQMLGALSQSGALKGIGDHNVAVTRERLAQANLTLAACDFGGTMGRTLSLNIATGLVTVRTSGGQPREL